MFKTLIQFIKRKMGKTSPTRRQPLYDAQDPRRLARQRDNRIYHKTLKQYQQAEKRNLS